MTDRTRADYRRLIELGGEVQASRDGATRVTYPVFPADDPRRDDVDKLIRRYGYEDETDELLMALVEAEGGAP